MKKKVIKYALLIFFSLTLIISLYKIVGDYRTSKGEQDANAAIAELMHLAEQNAPVLTEKTESKTEQKEPEIAGEPTAAEASEQTEESETPTEPAILPQFAELYEMNPDLAGWLTVEGAGIDLPVMYTPSEQNRYLHLGFDGNYAASGSLFIGVPWGEGTNNTLIYGHHMKNGSMFGYLNRYAKASFGAENPTARFDTLYEKGEYELVAAFYSEVYRVDDTEHFQYYEYADLSDRDTFEYFVSEVKKAALYDTGVTPEWGDRLLALSTCEYHKKNGRFVVVFRQITD